MTNYNHFIDNNVFRIDYFIKSIYYDARTGEEIEYVEDVKKDILEILPEIKEICDNEEEYRVSQGMYIASKIN